MTLGTDTFVVRDGKIAVQTFAANMDARQLTVVAFVRDRASNRILQAIQIDPALPEEDA